MVSITLKENDQFKAYKSLGTVEELAKALEVQKSVVRCGECKSFYPAGKSPAYDGSNKDHCFWGAYDSNGYIVNRFVSEDDSCSFGRRRE